MSFQRIFAVATLQFLFIFKYGYTLTECRKDYINWYCFENEKCGETDGSCSNDPILKLMCIVCHYIRTNRRKRAIEELSREIQTIIDQNTQQVIVHVVPDSSITNAPSTEQEQPPPTYHQATELKPLQN